jgi:hypothetical protein
VSPRGRFHSTARQRAHAAALTYLTPFLQQKTGISGS